MAEPPAHDLSQQLQRPQQAARCGRKTKTNPSGGDPKAEGARIDFGRPRCKLRYATCLSTSRTHKHHPSRGGAERLPRSGVHASRFEDPIRFPEDVSISLSALAAGSETTDGDSSAVGAAREATAAADDTFPQSGLTFRPRKGDRFPPTAHYSRTITNTKHHHKQAKSKNSEIDSNSYPSLCRRLLASPAPPAMVRTAGLRTTWARPGETCTGG